jgi:HTH-type transcriptional regulator / antitoxin HigA
MNWKVLKTDEDYNKASLRLMEIFHAELNSPESDELDLLIVLVKDYDDKHTQCPNWMH